MAEAAESRLVWGALLAKVRPMKWRIETES